MMRQNYLENTTSCSRRRRRCASLSTTLSLVCFVSFCLTADAFCLLEPSSRRPTRTKNRLYTTELQAANKGDKSPRRLSPLRLPKRVKALYARLYADDGNDEEGSRRRSSPLKVRKRVKAVLDKARNRTGIQNSSSKPSSVVADAASLGGLGDGPLDFVIQKSEKNGKKNGAYNSFSVDDLILEDQKPNGSDKNKKPKDFDTISGDIPAANQFCEPMPFTLPKLNKEQMQQLKAGERVQEQARMGREGSGYVVLDVKAPPFVVWECLLDFESYPQLISTVRDVQIFANQNLGTGSVNKEPAGTGSEIPHYGTPSSTRASFVLSKFRLNIAAIHKYTPHPEGDYMEFNLDKSSTNMVLKGAKGIWHTIENPDGREGYTRVYLLCEVSVSRALPSFIVDYTADRAMPRATTWLRPQVEAAAELWLKRKST